MTHNDSRPKRRWLYIPLLIGLGFFAAYGFLWRAGAAEMKKAVLVWVDDQRAAGMDVTHGEIKTSGFPFFLRAIIDDVAIAAPGEWLWRGEQLAIDALPYDLNRLIFSPAGEVGEWRIVASDMRASIASDKSRDWVFAMTIGELHARRATDGATVSLGVMVFDLAPDAVTKTTLVLNLAASDALARANGEDITLASWQSVTGLSQIQALSGADPASRWRRAGGVLTIAGLTADIERTQISLEGAIHIDSGNYPAGAIDAEIRNPAGVLRLLGKTG